MTDEEDIRHMERTGAPRWRRLCAIAAMLMLMLTASPAFADSEAELGDDLRIEEVSATAAGRGGISRLSFKLVNDGSAGLQLARITAAVADDARLMVSVGPGKSHNIGSIGIAEGTTLDMQSSHIWYEISPLRRALVPGESFDAVFDFVNFRVTVRVHVQGGGPILPSGPRSSSRSVRALAG